MICLVFGSRQFANQSKAEFQILELLNEYCKGVIFRNLRENFVFVTGGAIGTDQIGAKIARHNGFPVAIVRPNYKKYAGGATHIRNDFMLKHAGIAIGFWNGTYVKSGTASVYLKGLKQDMPMVLNKWSVPRDEFVEIEPEIFMVNAPINWLKKWVSIKWIKENYPSYIFPQEAKYQKV